MQKSQPIAEIAPDPAEGILGTWQWYSRLNTHVDALTRTGRGVGSCFSVGGYARDLAAWSDEAEQRTGWPFPLEYLNLPARQFLASGGSCDPDCSSGHPVQWHPRWDGLGLLVPDAPQAHAERVADTPRVSRLAPEERSVILDELLGTWPPGDDAERVRRRCLGES